MAPIVFCTAFVTLAIEVFYTRLFSALFWRNTAFAILSLAMLGIGASGVLVYLRPKWFTKERAEAHVAWLATAFGLSIVVSYLWILRLSKTIDNMMAPVWEYATLVVAGLLPFFAGGLVLSVVFTHFASQIARLYLFDLVGAALGAVLVLPLLTWLNGPLLIPALALATAIPAAVFAHQKGIGSARAGALVATLALLGLGGLQQARGVLDVTYSNGHAEQNVAIERWDPQARITVHRHGPTSVWFNIDSHVVTPVLPFRGDVDEMGFLKGNVLQLVYHLKPYPKIVIIGPGGGSDVMSALTFGNSDITAVEVNRSIINIMRDELRIYSGALYDRPEVEIVIADGRAHVAAMTEKVDLIQATFIDTFAASASGAHTLSENYLYTVDGMHDFLGHLKPDGLLSMSRWGGKSWGFVETHRAIGLVAKALEERGVDVVADHVVVVRGATPERLTKGFGYQTDRGDMESMATILVKESPFTAPELEKLRSVSESSGHIPLWLGSLGGPDHTIRSILDPTQSAAFYEEKKRLTGMDYSPVTDGKPFFFDVIDPIEHLFNPEREDWAANPYYWARLVGITVMEQLLIATLVLVLALIVVPLLSRWSDLRGVARPVSTLGYFVCLGLGFIGVELAMMQSFSLFLGHPVYSLVVLLAAILFSSGLGSSSTGKIESGWAKTGSVRALVLVGILCVYGPLLPIVTKALMQLPFIAKALFCVVVAAPPAYLMGMMFPLGVRAIQGRYERLVPWVWGLNSSFSVLGAIASLFIAMSYGHLVTWYVFVAMYGLAALALHRMAGADDAA